MKNALQKKEGICHRPAPEEGPGKADDKEGKKPVHRPGEASSKFGEKF
jgi:hypothetical protein